MFLNSCKNSYVIKYTNFLLKNLHFLKQFWGMPLQYHYTRHIILYLMYLELYKVLISKNDRILSYMDLKKVLFYVIKVWYYMEYVFKSSKFTTIQRLTNFEWINCWIKNLKTNSIILIFDNSLNENTNCCHTVIFNNLLSFDLLPPWWYQRYSFIELTFMLQKDYKKEFWKIF